MLFLVLTRVLACALLLIAAWSAACGPFDQGESGKGADQILNDATASFDRAKYLKLDASFVDGKDSYTMNVRIARPLSGQGTIGVNGSSLDFIASGSKAYVRSLDFAALAGMTGADASKVTHLLGDSWVLATDAQTTAAIKKMIDPPAFKKAFILDRVTLQKTTGLTVQGHPAVKLSDRTGDIYVSVDGTPSLLSIDSAPGVTENGLKNLSIAFSDYGRSITVTPPDKFIDFSNPSTLPARFDAQSFAYGAACDDTGCDMSAVFKNAAGPGTATAVFTIADSAHNPISTCRSQIPETPTGQTVTVTCRLTSAEWTQWYDAHIGSSYYGSVIAESPYYSP